VLLFQWLVYIYLTASKQQEWGGRRRQRDKGPIPNAGRGVTFCKSVRLTMPHHKRFGQLWATLANLYNDVKLNNLQKPCNYTNKLNRYCTSFCLRGYLSTPIYFACLFSSNIIIFGPGIILSISLFKIYFLQCQSWWKVDKTNQNCVNSHPIYTSNVDGYVYGNSLIHIWAMNNPLELHLFSRYLIFLMQSCLRTTENVNQRRQLHTMFSGPIIGCTAHVMPVIWLWPNKTL
jgi:hypothetical protein